MRTNATPSESISANATAATARMKTASAVTNEGGTPLCLARSGDGETLEEKAETLVLETMEAQVDFLAVI